MTHYSFPPDFVWGTATAAYQIEGAVHEDGRGESIWDRFSHTPGKVTNGDTGDVACDHYHRYRDDIAIMRDLGLKAYRFSIAWPRILPQGDGPVNEAGVAFYDRLVDALLEAGITPFATLYHWDLPQALQDRQGGWEARAIVEQFAHYADVISRRLGDRIKYWTTFNEPEAFTYLGYIEGRHAPGLTDLAACIQVVHHVLVAHGTAIPVLRRNVGQEAQIGIVCSQSPIYALDNHPDTLEQQRQMHSRMNLWLVEPLFLGTYPAAVREWPHFAELTVKDGDMDVIRTPIDFFGVNYYTRHMAGKKQSSPTGRAPEYTEMGWEVYPQGLYETLKRIHDDYAPRAFYITENGAAFQDVVTPDGQIHDERRVAYLREHFRAAWQAIQDGVPLRGYFVWSLLDNFEWANGYAKRFGVMYTDYTTQKRRPKDSARFYQSVIRSNGLPE